MPSDAPTAFFSYSREDLEFALRLAKDLKKAGASVWMDKLDIRAGQLWERRVEEALGTCPRVLVILSPSSVNSPQVMAEVAFALDEQKEVIPVIYRDCKIPYRLRPIQHVDFRTDYSEAFQELLDSMGVERPQETAAALEGPAPPPEQASAPAPEPKPAPVPSPVAPSRVIVLARQADEGNARAMAELGYLYGVGEGVPKNPKQSYLWYRKAAEAGDVSGMFNLALVYSAEGELKDEAKAVEWYRRAARAGDRNAMFNLADSYEHGKGINRDYKEAIKWYGKANDSEVEGAADALQRVSYLLEEADQAVERERLEQERKAAEQARLEQEERDRRAAEEKIRWEEEERARQERERQERQAAAEKARSGRRRGTREAGAGAQGSS